MNWELILLLTGIMLFAYWLNYIMGSPLADKPEDVDPKAILFWFPQSLAKSRLIQHNVFMNLYNNHLEELSLTSNIIVAHQTKVDFKKNILVAGREFFTWERAILCPICLHWWLSVNVGIYLLGMNAFDARDDFFQAAFTYLVLHLIIRKIS